MSPRVTADFPGGAVAEVEQVAQHDPLLRAQVAGLGFAVFGLVDRILDLVAQRRLALAAEDQSAHAAPQARATVVVVAGRHQQVSK